MFLKRYIWDSFLCYISCIRFVGLNCSFCGLPRIHKQQKLLESVYSGTGITFKLCGLCSCPAPHWQYNNISLLSMIFHFPFSPYNRRGYCSYWIFPFSPLSRIMSGHFHYCKVCKTLFLLAYHFSLAGDDFYLLGDRTTTLSKQSFMAEVHGFTQIHFFRPPYFLYTAYLLGLLEFDRRNNGSFLLARLHVVGHI